MDLENERETFWKYSLDTLKYYYNFFLMTTKGRVVAGAVFVAIGCYKFSQWKHRENHRDISAIRKTPLENNLNHENDNFQRLLENQKKEMEKEEQEENERRRIAVDQRMADRRQNLQKAILEMAANDEENHRKFMKLKEESEERLSKIMQQNKRDQAVKNAIANLEIDQLRSQGKREVEAIQTERLRAREIHQRNSERLDEEFEADRRNFELKEQQRKEELQREKERAEQRKREIEDQLEKDLEELRRRGQQRRAEMEEYLYQIQRALQMKVWNQIIESNWTNRLNALRSSFQDIQKSYNQMKRVRDESNLDTSKLLSAISQQKELMENEAIEMDKLYNEHGKTFLLDIKDSVIDVKEECNRLIYVLKNEPSNTSRIEECFSALSAVTSSIPTLAELKSRNEESMK
ncbi:hypothetical protein L5515_007567 [Caenorhabditis briggsae]|uniref:Uncharacterized protein n=2 Tax=Caenorhabditis briggsae TaxID=6238 RepID=A0AAE9F543_CAEBR|nr:hypothetical protein L5515_007567 [Caenorhabditis briggsae]